MTRFCLSSVFYSFNKPFHVNKRENVFIFLNENICCGYTKELSQWDGYENIHNFTLKILFLHGNSLREAVWSRKIYVQIMRFTCCLNMAFTWKGPNWALIYMHDVTLECVAALLIISPMFSFAKTLHAYIWRCGDVMTFESWQWRHFVLRNQV